MSVKAVQQIRRMRGKAQAQLMLGEDEQLYVVKFQNSPQHPRVPANEHLGTLLAREVGLAVPRCEVIEVDDYLIAKTPELAMETGSKREPCMSGFQFGSCFVGGGMGGVFDYLPDGMLADVANLHEFTGMLALDKWTGNMDSRQAVFAKEDGRYVATFIDQGDCFNAGSWSFLDNPRSGVSARGVVYEKVTGWECFEPWLERIESMDPGIIWDIAWKTQPEWYGSDESVLEELIEALAFRRNKLRELIGEFRDSLPPPFPNWEKKAATNAVPAAQRTGIRLLGSSRELSHCVVDGPPLSNDMPGLDLFAKELRNQIIEITGDQTFYLLLVHALNIATTVLPGLSLVRINPAGTFEGLASLPAKEAEEGGALLVAKFLGLFSDLVGENVARRLLQGKWPELIAVAESEEQTSLRQHFHNEKP